MITNINKNRTCNNNHIIKKLHSKNNDTMINNIFKNIDNNNKNYTRRNINNYYEKKNYTLQNLNYNKKKNNKSYCYIRDNDINNIKLSDPLNHENFDFEY